jgi:hypothetical protein
VQGWLLKSAWIIGGVYISRFEGLLTDLRQLGIRAKLAQVGRSAKINRGGGIAGGANN